MSIPDKSLLQTVDELSQLRAHVSQCQATLKLVLSTAPTMERYKSLSHFVMSNETQSGSPLYQNEMKMTIDKLKELVNDSPQIKVAVRMKQLYDRRRLPLIHKFCEINFKTATGLSDGGLADFLEFVPENSVGNSRKKMKEEEGSNSGFVDADIYSYPPALPKINNQKLLIRITTDKSYRQLSDFVESSISKLSNSHNGKLSIRGRAILEWLLFEILDEKLPHVYEEDLTVIRSRLMSREMLAKFSFGYGLVDAIKYNLSNEADTEEKMDVIGKIFLSYIAGLEMEEKDINLIKRWLGRLYEPMINRLSSSNGYYGNSNPETKIGMVELKALFQSVTNINKLPYKDINFKIIQSKTDPFVAEILVNDQVLGLGSSVTSFEEAQDRAAMDIINDKTKIVKVFTIMKENYLANQKPKNITVSDTGSVPCTKIEGANLSSSIPSPLMAPNGLRSSSSSSRASPIAMRLDLEEYSPPGSAPALPAPPASSLRHQPSSPSPSPSPPPSPLLQPTQESSTAPPPPATVTSTRNQFSQQSFPLNRSYDQFSTTTTTTSQPGRYDQYMHSSSGRYDRYQPQKYNPISNTRLSTTTATIPISTTTKSTSSNSTINSSPAHTTSLLYRKYPNTVSEPQSNEYSSLNLDPSIPVIPLSHRDVDMKAKNNLYAKLGPMQLKADYEQFRIGSEFHTCCSVEGVKLGYGIDTTKQRSSQKAAMAALMNRNALIGFGINF
ncbi:hypothetical protein KGF56_003098 [Candida oxycetoniae]|uniref:RNase III domain-containing protein n=1 Tax=Candida oxycetoniae TaxID=497107 RepID=A0AAI9WXB1_9ASCO|nr:uncharacterized protein KGF56_003098 [Candida oxycetoniae]KAI3404062.2 hypothetical protein KGF56_003098 [Candida oxycetoniae]